MLEVYSDEKALARARNGLLGREAMASSLPYWYRYCCEFDGIIRLFVVEGLISMCFGYLDAF